MSFRAVRQILKREFPINRRLVVRIDDEMEDRLGECWMDGETINIAIAPASEIEQCHTLAHEYAHARIFDRHGKQRNRHSREWVAEYARIYRRLFE